MHRETQRTRATGRWRRTLAGAALAVSVLAAGVPAVGAFKPYTHAQTGDAVLIDVAEGGDVTIGGREYPVRQEVVDALTDWPEFYNAGVIGPDGFPDLTYGQSVIHSEDTGLWLRHIFESAWDVQASGSYDAEQKSQILAFAYGYLMHAAGDMWAHTLVNDLSGGVFPPVGQVLSDAQKRAIALRHLIIEGYIGDATPGYDSNPARGDAPGGDVSDDSTPGIDFPTREEFGGLKRFLYETMIDPAADTPTAARGPVVDYFLNLRATLATQVDDWDPDPIGDLVGAWEQAKDRYDNIGPKVAKLEAAVAKFNDCEILDFTCTKAGILATEIVPAALALGFTVTMDTVGAIGDLIAGAVQAAFDAVGAAVDALFDAYLVAWIEDIDAGLQEWPEVGRASTIALFSPQARRDLQNEKCEKESPDEDHHLRINCEKDIGFRDVLFDEADPFINQHLLSMLGLPDAVGGIRQALQDMSDFLDDLLEPISKPFDDALRPLNESVEQLKDLAKDLVVGVAEEALGVDFDMLTSFLTHPAQWIDVQDITVELPFIGEVTIQDLFAEGTRDRLDAYLGFPADGSHLQPSEKPFDDFPVENPVRLKDTAEFDPSQLPVFQNAVTMGKLLLLDGPTLDQVMTDLTGHEYSYYGSQPYANVMLTGLAGAPGDPSMWLSNIDADHAWRADGQPRFDAPSGGEGNFPMWESCVLRDDVFRTLFVDWENGDDQFPDLDDAPTVDPNDPEAPTSALVVSGNSHTAGGTTYLGGDGVLTLDVDDDFWFDEEIGVDVRITDHAGTVRTAELGEGDEVDLSGLADGPVTIELQASDPCRTEAAHTESFVIDTTAPTITIDSPAPEGRVFDTDDLSSIGWTSDDGTHGSGVATESATFDGDPAAEGDVLDMFLLDPGTHRIVVTASDHLGNTATEDRTFVVRATAASLASNVQRAYDEGLITKNDVRKSLADKTASALQSHGKGKHSTEHNQLGAFVNAIEAQRGKSIDRTTADRFIAYARDLIATGG